MSECYSTVFFLELGDPSHARVRVLSLQKIVGILLIELVLSVHCCSNSARVDQDGDNSLSFCGDSNCNIPNESSLWCNDCFCGDGICDSYERQSIICASDCAKSITIVNEPYGPAAGLLTSQPSVAVLDASGLYSSVALMATAQIIDSKGVRSYPENMYAFPACGVFPFTDLRVNKAGTVILQFTVSYGEVLLSSQSRMLTLTYGAAHHLHVVQEPAGILVSALFKTQPKVQVLDILGNLVDNSTVYITASVRFGCYQDYCFLDSSFVLKGGTVRQSVGGLATFTTLFFSSKSQGVELLFSAGDIILPASSSLLFVADNPDHLDVLSSPLSGTAAGEILYPQPSIAVSDRSGVLSSWADDNIKCPDGIVIRAQLMCVRSDLNILEICTTSNMYGNKAVVVNSGISNFTDLSIDRVGSGYAILFDVVCGYSGVISATSDFFNVSYGKASRLELAQGTSPTGASPGCLLSVQPRIIIEDKFGNLVGDAKIFVTAILLQESAPSNHSLIGNVVQISCKTPDCECARVGCGLASWGNLQINDLGYGFSIGFLSLGLSPTLSFPPFNVQPGTAYEVFIVLQPSGIWPGLPLKQQPVVGLKDRAGNIAQSNETLILAQRVILKSEESVCSLSSATALITTLGKSAFTDLSTPSLGEMDILCGGHSHYQLRFSFLPSSDVHCVSSAYNPVSTVDSVVLHISEEPKVIVVSQQPGNGVAGEVIGPAKVSIHDNNGTLATWYLETPYMVSATVCINIKCPSGLDESGVRYGVPCFACADDKIEFCQNQTQTPPPLVPQYLTDPGISGKMQIVVEDGVSTFTDIRFQKVGTYLLRFSVGFATIDSQSFIIVEGRPIMFDLLVQPGMAVPGQALKGQPVVALLDAGRNIAVKSSYGSGGIVTATLSGSPNGTLLTANDITTVPQANFRFGVAEFEGLRVDIVGCYQMIFTSLQLDISIDSILFDVVAGSISSLLILQVPDGCVYNLPCSILPKVSLQDAGGNVVPTSLLPVTASLVSLSCTWIDATTTEYSKNGIVHFEHFTVYFQPVSAAESSCNGKFEISFTYSNLTAASSGLFFVSKSPAYLNSKISPAYGIPGAMLSPSPSIYVSDSQGQVVMTAVVPVSVELLQCNCSNFSCCYSVTVPKVEIIGQTLVESAFGVAVFSNLRLDRARSCYRLRFSSPSLISASSRPFDVLTGTSVAFIAILQQTNETDSGIVMEIQPRVAVMDKGQNVRIDLTGQMVTVMQFLQGNARISNEIWSGGTQAFQQHGSIFQGEVLFTDLRLDFASCCLKLQFIYNSYVGYTLPFVVHPGPPRQLFLLHGLSNALPGWIFDRQPNLGFQDVFGNSVQTSNCKYECSNLKTVVSAMICSLGPVENETLLGSSSVPAHNGLALFTNLRIDRAGNHTLCFKSSKDTVNGTSFNIFVAPATDRASRLSILVQPFGAKATPTITGSRPIPFSVQPVVGITDIGKNVIYNAQTAVSVRVFDPLQDYTSGLCRGQSNCPLLSGNTTVFTIDGQAIFTDLSVTPPCKGLILEFTSSNRCTSSGYYCDSATTLPFDASGAISSITVVAAPTYEIAGRPFVVQPQIKIVDDRGRWYTFSNTPKEVIFVSAARRFTNISKYHYEPQINDVELIFDVSFNLSFACIQRGNTLMSCSRKSMKTNISNLFGNTTALYTRGSALFTDLHLNDGDLNEEYSLTFTLLSSGPYFFSPVTYCCVYVSSAQADKMLSNSVYSQQVPGEVIKGPVIVWFLDQYENIARKDGANVTASLLMDGIIADSAVFPAAGSSAISMNGITVFSQLFCYRPGSKFSFLFQSEGLKDTMSTEFNVSSYGTIFKLQISRPLDGVMESKPFEVQPVISVLDKVDNLIGYPVIIAVTLIGAQLSALMSGSSLIRASFNGKVEYTDLSITYAASNYSLRFSVLSSPIFVDSEFFDVAQSLAQLQVINKPTSASIGGQEFDVQPLVQLSDMQNRRVYESGGIVVAFLDSYSHPSPCLWPKTFRCSVPDGICSLNSAACPQLLGSTMVNVKSGYAQFTDLKIGPCNTDSSSDCSRGLYRINFVLNNVFHTNYSIVVNVGTAVALRFKSLSWTSTLPAQIGGIPFNVQPALYLIDAGGNVVSSATRKVKVTLNGGTYDNYWVQLGLNRENLASFCSGIGAYCPCVEDVLKWQAYSGTDTTKFTSLVHFYMTKTALTQAESCNCPDQPDCIYPNCSCSPSWFGSKTMTSVNGTVLWTDIGIRTSGLFYSLRFSLDSYVIDSAMFNVMFGAAYQLQPLVHPDNAFASSPFSVQPVIAVLDLAKNIVTSYVGTVSATLLPNDRNELIGGTNIMPALGGIIRFSNLQVRTTYSCYFIRFTAQNLLPAISRPFNVSLNLARSYINLHRSPGDINPGFTFQTQPIISVQDAGGNLIENYPYLIDVVLTNSSGTIFQTCSFSYNRKTAGCQTRVRPIKGLAFYTDLRIDLAGKNYQLIFRSIDTLGNLIPAQNAIFGPFDVLTGNPFQLFIKQQPLTQLEGGNVGLIGQPGQNLAQQPIIVVQDAGGNTVPATSVSGVLVTAVLYQNGQPSTSFSFPSYEPPMLLYDPALTNPDVMTRILTRAVAGNGKFAFTALRIDRASENYTIRFVSNPLLWTESLSFSVYCGPPYKLSISRLPFGIKYAALFSVQPIITMQDRGGNLVHDNQPSLAVAASLVGPGFLEAKSTIHSLIQGGYAIFTNLAISTPGNGFRMTFSASSYLSATTDSFNVSGPGTMLKMAVQPFGSVAAFPLLEQPIVYIVDEGGRLVNSDCLTNVTASIMDSSNPLMAIILGDNIVRCCWGVCKFTDLSISKAGSHYQLQFDSVGMVAASSLPFEMKGPVALLIERNPGSAKSNSPFGIQPRLVVVDVSSNVVSACDVHACSIGGDAFVSASLLSGIGGQKFAILMGTLSAPLSGGIAVFSDLAIQGPGGVYGSFVEAPYALRFSTVDLRSVDSEYFNLTYQVRPPTGYVKAGIRIYGIKNNLNVLTIEIQKQIASAVSKRLSIESDTVQIYSVTLQQGSRRIDSIGQHFDVIFYVWSNSSTRLINMASSLSSWLKREGAIAIALGQEGLVDVKVDLLLDAEAFAWDGSRLKASSSDNASSIIGGVVGGVFALTLVITFAIMWIRAKRHAKIRNEELGEEDLMQAIGMQDFESKIEETALLPWTAEKILVNEGPEAE